MTDNEKQVEALTVVILPALPNHCCPPGDLTDCPWDAHDAQGVAEAILKSDWLAAREQAARRETAEANEARINALADLAAEHMNCSGCPTPWWLTNWLVAEASARPVAERNQGEEEGA